jgi:signal peptidase II
MQNPDHHPGKWWYLAFFLIALLVIASDQLSKTWIRTYPVGQTIGQISFLRITHIQNTGSAFGMFQGQNLVLMIVACIGIILVLLYVFLIPGSG